MAADFAGDQFGYKRERPLSRASKFQNVEAQIVRFDDGGQRPAFTQGRDVAGRR